MKKKKLGTLILSALLLIGVLAGCGNSADGGNKSAAGSLDAIKKRGKLIVGVFSDKPPFGFTDEKGNYIGFDNDLAKRFAKDLLGDESKVEFVPVEPASRIPYLQSDKVDLILANMTVTDARKEQVDFTNPTMKVATQVLVSDKSGIKTLDDLKGKKIIVTKGTTADIYLTEHRKDVELIKYDKNTESLQALKDGRGDGYAQDNFILISWAKDNPGFHLIDEKLEKEAPIAPAVKKGNTELRDWVNKELQTLGKEHYLIELYNKYVKDALGADTDPYEVITEDGKI
ncbi:transporter substrate-binding domain-containing protein [Paenibacillus sediminis]|uniref:Polar amino acid transport system substrate-binding protein n=1 Tax=Paenibacillus sediminis TaxID=664909 RepID=A0ABS4H0V9_9BACL|nr:transporter substrate-binding domain-containing protein [Paenibacillus sediminis]MBP1936154.1 polar amino acid transport system substrate-binding protein [Paenibacillus sediminis]